MVFKRNRKCKILGELNRRDHAASSLTLSLCTQSNQGCVGVNRLEQFRFQSRMCAVKVKLHYVTLLTNDFEFTAGMLSRSFFLISSSRLFYVQNKNLNGSAHACLAPQPRRKGGGVHSFLVFSTCPYFPPVLFFSILSSLFSTPLSQGFRYEIIREMNIK